MATRGSRYPVEVRVKAIARLSAGEHYADVARDIGCSQTSLKKWSSEAGLVPVTHGADVGKAVVLKDKEIVEPARATLGRMVSDYIEVALRAITVQAMVMGDEDWLRQQTAADVARVHAVLISKTTQFLAAIQPAFGGTAVEPDPSYDDLDSDYEPEPESEE